MGKMRRSTYKEMIYYMEEHDSKLDISEIKRRIKYTGSEEFSDLQLRYLFILARFSYEVKHFQPEWTMPDEYVLDLDELIAYINNVDSSIKKNKFLEFIFKLGKEGKGLPKDENILLNEWGCSKSTFQAGVCSAIGAMNRCVVPKNREDEKSFAEKEQEKNLQKLINAYGLSAKSEKLIKEILAGLSGRKHKENNEK